MTKQKKIFIIFSIIILQTITASAVGFAVNYASSSDILPDGTTVVSVDLSGLDIDQAVETLESQLGSSLSDRKISLRGGQRLFTFEYRDIDGRLDAPATVQRLFDKKRAASVARVFGGDLAPLKDMQPVITFNEGKLKRLLEEFARDIEIQPEDASVSFVVGMIDKKAGSSGKALDIDRTLSLLRDGMDGSDGQVFELDASSGAIRNVPPDIMLKDLEPIEEIISDYSVKPATEMWDSDIRIAVEAINGTLIKAKSNSGMKGNSSFSFNDCMEKAGIVEDGTSQGFDMVASALYAALLRLPMDNASFSRTPHENTVDYIDAGLDAAVLKGKYDLKFENTLENPLVIMAEYSDGIISVKLAGSSSDSGMGASLSADIVQRIEPGIVTLENSGMKKGETRVIAEGREGLAVNVYRVSLNDSGEETKVLLHSDTYKPVNIVREAGPGTKFNDSYKK